MAELNKNVLTDEQKLAKEIIDKIYDLLKTRCTKYGSIRSYDLERVMKEINREYKLIPQYDTLEKYIKEHYQGVYHRFVFYIDGRQMYCYSVEEFGSYYNSEILKDFIVVNDEEKDNKGDCESLECIHELTIKPKGEFE